MAKPKAMERRKAMLTAGDINNAPGLRWRLEQTAGDTIDQQITAIVAWLWRTELINSADELKALGYELEYGPAGETLQRIAD